jgi:hypothetical protein
MMEKIFDLQFWVIMIILTPVLIFSGRWLKRVLVATVIHSISGVVEEQWGQMFKKLDEYKATVTTHGIDIEKLKLDCEELGRIKVDKKDIDDIIRKVQGIK